MEHCRLRAVAEAVGPGVPGALGKVGGKGIRVGVCLAARGAVAVRNAVARAHQPKKVLVFFVCWTFVPITPHDPKTAVLLCMPISCPVYETCTRLQPGTIG